MKAPTLGQTLEVYSSRARTWFLATITSIDGDHIKYHFEDTGDIGDALVSNVETMPGSYRLIAVPTTA